MKKAIMCIMPSFVTAVPLLLDIEVINHSNDQVIMQHKAPALQSGNTPNLYTTKQNDTLVFIHPQNSYTYSQVLTSPSFSLEIPLMLDSVLLGKAGSSVTGQLMFTVNMQDGHLEQYEYQFDNFDDWLNNISHELEIQNDTILHRMNIY